MIRNKTNITLLECIPFDNNNNNNNNDNNNDNTMSI